jgi:hypothetical protein
MNASFLKDCYANLTCNVDELKKMMMFEHLRISTQGIGVATGSIGRIGWHQYGNNLTFRTQRDHVIVALISAQCHPVILL